MIWVNGKYDVPYMKFKTKFMFETWNHQPAIDLFWLLGVPTNSLEDVMSQVPTQSKSRKTLQLGGAVGVVFSQL